MTKIKFRKAPMQAGFADRVTAAAFVAD